MAKDWSEDRSDDTLRAPLSPIARRKERRPVERVRVLALFPQPAQHAQPRRANGLSRAQSVLGETLIEGLHAEKCLVVLNSPETANQGVHAGHTERAPKTENPFAFLHRTGSRVAC